MPFYNSCEPAANGSSSGEPASPTDCPASPGLLLGPVPVQSAGIDSALGVCSLEVASSGFRIVSRHKYDGVVNITIGDVKIAGCIFFLGFQPPPPLHTGTSSHKSRQIPTNQRTAPNNHKHLEVLARRKPSFSVTGSLEVR